MMLMKTNHQNKKLIINKKLNNNLLDLLNKKEKKSDEIYKDNEINKDDEINNFINKNVFNGDLILTYNFHPRELQQNINKMIENYYFRYSNSSYYIFYVRKINKLIKKSYGEIDFSNIEIKIILNVEYKLYKVNEIYSARISFQITTNIDDSTNIKFEAYTDELFIELNFDVSKIILNNNKINIKNSDGDIIINNNDIVNVKITDIKQLQKEDGFIEKLFCKGELV